MFSPSPRLSAPLSSRGLSRRDLVLGGTALALSAVAYAPPRARARQGHSPLKPEDPANGVPNLRSLLELVPGDYIARVGDNGVPWQYADFDRQFASLGLHHDIDGLDFENEPFQYGTYSLAPASSVFNFALVEDLVTAIGFQPYGIDQNLYVGAPGRQLSMFRGGFDPVRVIAAWTEAGYETHDTASGIPAWTIGREGEFVFDHPIQGKVLSELNNVAIVDDVLIYAPYMELLEIALSFIGGGGASMDEDAVQAGAVAAGRWESLVSLVVKIPYLNLAEVASHGAEGNVATLDLIQTQGPRLWRELLVIGDTLPFVPS